MNGALKNFPAIRRVAADRSLRGEPLRVALLVELTRIDMGVVGVLASRVVCDMEVSETQLRVFADHFALSAMIGSDDSSEDAPRLAAVGRALGLFPGEAERAMLDLGPALQRAGIEVAA